MNSVSLKGFLLKDCDLTTQSDSDCGAQIIEDTPAPFVSKSHDLKTQDTMPYICFKLILIPKTSVS